MKIISGILLFSLLLLSLSFKGILPKSSNTILVTSHLSKAGEDTSGYTRFLNVDTFKLEILPPSSGIQFYKDGIVFLSSTKNEDKMASKHISFGTIDAYYARLDDTILGRHSVFSPFVSFLYPCEAITFNPAYDTMYFTRISKKDNKEKIYLATAATKTQNQSGWLLANVPLDFCTDKNIYAYPTLSQDEKTMIFSSDRTGSHGGLDLYLTNKEGDKWTVPVNLGELINSQGNEVFPFLDAGNNLYFSSDGLPGLGGYDIFTCKFNGVGWDRPVNLSKHINSETDDIAFTINRHDEKSAFFTRRLRSGKPELQLFRVALNKEAEDGSFLTISTIFNGKPSVKTGLISLQDTTKAKVPETVLAKNEVVAGETEKDNLKTKPVVRADSLIKVPEAKTEPIKPEISAPGATKEVVVFRVQFRSGMKPQNEKTISMNGNTYDIYEYFYLGEYRNTVGEFSSVAPAVELMKIVRQSGYPQAFVAAFINNTRSLDPKLFR